MNLNISQASRDFLFLFTFIILNVGCNICGDPLSKWTLKQNYMQRIDTIFKLNKLFTQVRASSLKLQSICSNEIVDRLANFCRNKEKKYVSLWGLMVINC